MYMLIGQWCLTTSGAKVGVYMVGKLNSYLGYIHLPGLTSLPFPKRFASSCQQMGIVVRNTRFVMQS